MKLCFFFEHAEPSVSIVLGVMMLQNVALERDER